MKPRLEAAEYTAEDTRIHLRHFHAAPDLALFGGTLFGIGRVQDHRDADLMLALMRSWRLLRSRGCTKSEWWSAVRQDVERIAR